MNPNMFYAETFVDALARAGLEAVCIAPGSRSTPLTLSFAKHDGIKKYTHLDERSAAFFALGMAMASDKPVAMVCTSGTAAANFFPAIIEANMSRVPLLVLTADRPHELRHSGANQTIDQVKLYGDHVLWSVDMGLPEANPPEVAVRNLRTMAARALATADGRMEFRRKGVVHLNFPFRKPLEPEITVSEQWQGYSTSSITAIEPGKCHASKDQIRVISDAIKVYERGLIICGIMPYEPGHPRNSRAILGLGTSTGYPIIADALSGIRYEYPATVGAFETFFAGNRAIPVEYPDVVIQFGRIPTSKWLNAYLESLNPELYVQVSHDGVWSNDTHQPRQTAQAGIYEFCFDLQIALNSNRVSSYIQQWIALDRSCWSMINNALEDIFFDGAAIARMCDALPGGAILFAGNSNTIRHIEQFFQPVDSNVTHHMKIYASRGASGIDGQVSTALGIGASTGKHIYAILGDITFYHDMNGLLAVQRNDITATIIVINNNGGGIFERLPIREHEPYYTEYFTTPHGLTFEHAAAMYGLEYAFADDFASLDAALDKYINTDVSSIIEVKTDIKTDEARRKEIIEIVNQQIRQSLSDND